MDLLKTILTTNDGVDIHEGDWCWVIRDIKKEQPVKMRIYDYTYSLIENKNYIYFSTQTAAETYFFWNEPIYSRLEFKKLH